MGLTYDAFDREVEITSGSTHTQILYSPIGKLGLMNGQAASTIRIPLPGGSTAELLGATGGTTHILHSDWLGSSRLSTTYSSRAMAYDVAYAPYGENYPSSTGDLNFTGQSEDTLPGLYDFLYREYNPVQGRWISPDPSGLAAVSLANPQSWNRYAYVLNNPLAAVDPDGLDCVYITQVVCTSCSGPGSEGAQQISFHKKSGDCTPGDNGFYFDGDVDLESVKEADNGDLLANLIGGDGNLVCAGSCTDPVTVFGGPTALVPFTILSPTSAVQTISQITTATISNVPNGKEQYCQQQANKAAAEDLLPGVMKGDYTPSGQSKALEYAAHYAIDAAAGSTALKYSIRSNLGIPMSTTSKLLGRASGALLLYSGYTALKAAQAEYKACMAY